MSGEERAHVVEAALGDRWHRCEVCGAEGRQPPPPAAELADAIRAWVRAQLVDDGGLLDRIRVEARIAALQDAADVADASAITGLEQTRPGLVAIWLRKRAEALGASRELRDGGGEDVALPDAGMHEVIMWAVAAVLPVIAAREARIRAEVRDAD